MIVVADPAPVIVIVWLAPRSPTVLPSQPPAPVPLILKMYVLAGRLIVVLLLAGLLANWIAPRKLQSLAAPVHAEAAVSAAPEGSSVLSTVIVVFGAFGTIDRFVLVESSTTTSCTPLSFDGRVNAATGVLCTSRVVFAVSSVTISDWSGTGAELLLLIGLRISSFDCACPTTITSSISR